MRSEFLLGVAGLIIVLAVLVGGTIAASICHELLTPNFDICYMVWLWLTLIPFWWICTRTFALDHMQRPVATYLGLLPLLLLMHVLISQFGPGNPWLLLGILGTYYAYITIADLVRRMAQDWWARRSGATPDK